MNIVILYEDTNFFGQFDHKSRLKQSVLLLELAKPLDCLVKKCATSFDQFSIAA